MNQKKIVTLIVAASLTLGLVGGSLAWFSSSDNVTNSFATLQDDDNEGDSGIDIFELFDPDEAAKILPGGPAVNKYVQVKNTAKYAQLIRVKLTPAWTEDTVKAYKIAQGDDIADATNCITLNLTTNADTKAWVKDGDYYYFTQQVAAAGFTSNLLDSVSLNSSLGNAYKNAKFTVKVEAEAIQAVVAGDSTANPLDMWTISSTTLKAKLKALTSSTAVPFDDGNFYVLGSDGTTKTYSKATT